MKTRRPFKSFATALMLLCALAISFPVRADLTATVYPGYSFSDAEVPTTTTLNLLGLPTIIITGTLGGTNIAIGAGTITGTMLSGTIIDGTTLDFNSATPRQLEIAAQGVHSREINTNALGNGLTGGNGSPITVNLDTNSLRFTTNGTLAVQDTHFLGVTNVSASSVAFFLSTNAVSSASLSSELTLSSPTTNAQLRLTKFATTNYAIPAGSGTIIDLAHSLGATPSRVRCVLVCTNADNGYAVGDEIDVSGVNANQQPAFTYGANATNVFVTRNNGAFVFWNKASGTGAGTRSSWNVKIYAWP